jgi:hypothetical protein
VMHPAAELDAQRRHRATGTKRPDPRIKTSLFIKCHLPSSPVAAARLPQMASVKVKDDPPSPVVFMQPSPLLDQYVRPH